MKGKFDAYVLWPLDKRVQNWIVDWSTARDITVIILYKFQKHDVRCWVLVSEYLQETHRSERELQDALQFQFLCRIVCSTILSSNTLVLSLYNPRNCHCRNYQWCLISLKSSKMAPLVFRLSQHMYLRMNYESMKNVFQIGSFFLFYIEEIFSSFYSVLSSSFISIFSLFVIYLYIVFHSFPFFFFFKSFILSFCFVLFSLFVN